MRLHQTAHLPSSARVQINLARGCARRARPRLASLLTVAVLVWMPLMLPMDAHPLQVPEGSQGEDLDRHTLERQTDSLPPTGDSILTGAALKALSAPGGDTAEGLAIEPGFFNSPTGALLRSVAFPGWGQWSNGKKTKAAVCFAVETFFITKALIWRHRARESGLDFDTFDFARNRRNLYYWLTGFTGEDGSCRRTGRAWSCPSGFALFPRWRPRRSGGFSPWRLAARAGSRR